MSADNLSDLDTALSVPLAPIVPRSNRPPLTPGERPASSVWDGNVGVICTPVLAPTERIKSWDEYLIDSGLDPESVEVVEPVQVRAWDGPIAGGDVVRYRYYRLTVRTRRAGPTIDDLLAIVRRRRRPAITQGTTEGSTYSVDLGDLQLGKVDGDGAQGTLTRVVDGLDRAVAELKSLRRARVAIGTVKIGWLGDCVEGFVSQGGANAWRTTLTMTEQIRLLRRLMLHAVDLFAPLTDDLRQVAVPGNHDQAVRLAGKGLTRYDDSYDVEALVAVSDALAMNPATYGHVRTYTPAADEMTVTIETSGTIIGHAHGHAWRPGRAMEWWQGQAFGEQQIGRADVLLSGHLHHFHAIQSGRGAEVPPRTWIQVPALEAESTWWRHGKGISGAPGIVTSVMRDGYVGHVHIC